MVEHWLQQQAEITVALIVNSLDLYASVWLSERIWKCDHLSPNSDGLFESSFCVIFLNVCTTVPCMTQRDPIRQKWRRVVSVLLTTAVAVNVCGVMRREGKGTGQMIEPHPQCSAYCRHSPPPPTPRWCVKQNTATDRVANFCHRNNTKWHNSYSPTCSLVFHIASGAEYGRTLATDT